MVQVIETENPQGKLSEMLGMSLGQGLGNGLNTFFANRSLESVLKDKSLENAPISKKLEAIRSALSPYGDTGREIFNQRMQIEQQELQEIQEKKLRKENEKLESLNKIKSKAALKFINGEELSEQEESYFTPREIAELQKARQPKSPLGGLTGQAIPVEIAKNISSIIEQNKDANPDELAIKMANAGIPPIYSKDYIENRRREVENNTNIINQSYKNQEDYLNSITDSYRAANEMDMRLDQMLSLKDLPTPLMQTTLEAIGLPVSLFSSDAETAEKLSLDLTKNIQDFYGSRILQSEFAAFLRSIPTLKNTPEGRKRIIENMKTFNNLKRLEYNTARAMELDYQAKKQPLPLDFRRKVNDSMIPEATAVAKEFAQKNKATISNEKADLSDSKKIRVKSPSGKIGYMTLEQFEKAKANGVNYEPISR